jgi:hypothetical protein
MLSFIISILHQGDQIEEDEMCGNVARMGVVGNAYTILVRKLSVDEWVILKWILVKQGGRV